MACEKPSSSYKPVQMNMCQLCGLDMQSLECPPDDNINYQKQVDPPITQDGDEQIIPPDPVPQSPFSNSAQEPTIVHTSSIEYRVTSEVRKKPANQTGVSYIMNHGAMERADVEAWVEKKKRMAAMNQSWVGDGTYLETRPEMLHFFGKTTHMFLPDPDNPYGNSPPPVPVCKPRDGLDH